MTTRLPFAATQPLAMTKSPPRMDWCLFENGHCANAREHRQLRRLSMHLLECQLRSVPFASWEVSESTAKSPD